MAIVSAIQLYTEGLNKKGRLSAIDVGSKTLGFAISDRSWILASPLQTIHRVSWEKDVPKIQKIIQEQDIVALVIGLPLNMDGSEGERCQMVRKWTEKLLSFIDIDACYWDERLTTAAATDIMLEADLSRNRRKQLVDKVAASYILSSFLERQARSL